MKTQLTTLALLTALVTFNITNLKAEGFSFAEESYINDIPFDTKEVVAEKSLLNFDFEEESYIDDIPFNTEVVAAKEPTAPVVDFDEENYIDDIPFDTEKIAENYYYNKAVSQDFSFEEETYIDDIPFNTAVIANDKLAKLSF